MIQSNCDINNKTDELNIPSFDKIKVNSEILYFTLSMQSILNTNDLKDNLIKLRKHLLDIVLTHVDMINKLKIELENPFIPLDNFKKTKEEVESFDKNKYKRLIKLLKQDISLELKEKHIKMILDLRCITETQKNLITYYLEIQQTYFDIERQKKEKLLEERNIVRKTNKILIDEEPQKDIELFSEDDLNFYEDDEQDENLDETVEYAKSTNYITNCVLQGIKLCNIEFLLPKITNENYFSFKNFILNSFRDELDLLKEIIIENNTEEDINNLKLFKLEYEYLKIILLSKNK